MKDELRRVERNLEMVLGEFEAVTFTVMPIPDEPHQYTCHTYVDNHDTAEPVHLEFDVRMDTGNLMTVNTGGDHWSWFSHEAIWRALFWAGVDLMKDNPGAVQG